jgi:hypothetical protein
VEGGGSQSVRFHGNVFVVKDVVVGNGVVVEGLMAEAEVVLQGNGASNT